MIAREEIPQLYACRSSSSVCLSRSRQFSLKHVFFTAQLQLICVIIWDTFSQLLGLLRLCDEDVCMCVCVSVCVCVCRVNVQPVMFMCSIDVLASSLIARQMQQTRLLLALHLAALKDELLFIMSIHQIQRTTSHSNVIVPTALHQVHRTSMR